MKTTPDCSSPPKSDSLRARALRCWYCSSGGPGRDRPRPGRHGVHDDPATDPSGLRPARTAASGSPKASFGWQDRPNHHGRSRHGVPDRHNRRLPGQSRPARTATSGLPKPQQDRPDHHGRRRHGVPRPHDQRQPSEASRPARTATSGSPKPAFDPQDRRITTAGVVTEFSIPTARPVAWRHRGRPGWQPLVHLPHTPALSTITYVGRMTTAGVITGSFSISTAASTSWDHRVRPGRQPLVRRVTLSTYHIGRITAAGVVTEFPVPTAGSNPARSAPARTATSGSPSTGQPDRPDHARPVSSRTSRSRSPAAAPFGIAAGPDGNLLVRRNRVSTGSVRSRRPVSSRSSRSTPGNATPTESRPARTATSGSPNPIAGQQIGQITTAGNVTPSSRSPRPAATLEHHGRPGRQPLVHRRRAATRSDGSRPAASSPSSPIPTAGSDACRASRPARTATSGSPRIRATRSAGSRRPASITEFPIPTANSQPCRHRGRPGRQPLVHRERRQPDRPDHHGRRDHRVHRSRRPAAGPSGIAAGPDGNLWFTEADRQQDRADHHGRRRHRVPDPHGQQRPGAASRPARTATSGSPKPMPTRSGESRTAGVVTEFSIPTADSRLVGIAAGPDGNLWFTEAIGNQIGRITTGPTTPQPWPSTLIPYRE